MGNDPIRVMAVDDSRLIRELLADALEEANGIEIAGLAEDGDDAIKVFRKVRPDVVTLDVEMPRRNGLDTLEELLSIQPTRVIMFSSQTAAGAKTTLDALELGAMDYMEKPKGLAQLSNIKEELVKKIRMVMRINPEQSLLRKRQRAERRLEFIREKRTQRLGASPPQAEEQSAKLADKLVAVGISTGGPPALASMFEELLTPIPPMVIVQHMPAGFTKSFAERLNSLSPINVKEAQTGDVLKPNHAYVAAGGKHVKIMPFQRSGKLRVFDADPVSGHRPSVDVMMKSAAKIYGNRCLGAIMTGMGRDGADGCVAIRKSGGYVIGQDEKTSDVYGMNRVAFLEGGVDRQFPLDQAAVEIRKQVKRLWHVSALAGA